MAKTKIIKGFIAKIQGSTLTLDSGDCVVPSLNYSNKVGDAIKYVEARSLETVRYQAGATQWKESKATGKKFFKQV